MSGDKPYDEAADPVSYGTEAKVSSSIGEDGVPHVKVEYLKDTPPPRWLNITTAIAKVSLAVAVALGLAGMILALRSASQDRDQVQTELTCRSVSAVAVDQAIAVELANMGRGITLINEGLVAVADPAGHPAGDDLIPRALANGEELERSAIALLNAVAERSTSIEACSK